MKSYFGKVLVAVSCPAVPLTRCKEVDKKGAQYFLTLNPREPKYYPLTIQASAKILNAAGVDFTIFLTLLGSYQLRTLQRQ